MPFSKPLDREKVIRKFNVKLICLLGNRIAVEVSVSLFGCNCYGFPALNASGDVIFGIFLKCHSIYLLMVRAPTMTQNRVMEMMMIVI